MAHGFSKMNKGHVDVFYDFVRTGYDDSPSHLHEWQFKPLAARYDNNWRIAIETETHFIRVIARARAPRWGTATIYVVRKNYGRVIRYDVVRPGFPYPYPSNIDYKG
jgi:hypothetical protein